jgi:hypothetical protein
MIPQLPMEKSDYEQNVCAGAESLSSLYIMVQGDPGSLSDNRTLA